MSETIDPNATGRISRVDLITVSIPFTDVEHSATLSRIGFDNVLVRLETQEGCVGWGEISGASGAPVEVVRSLADLLKPLVIGRRIFESNLLRKALIETGRLANVRRLAHLVIAGFDFACWDAAGKLLGRPIHDLLGGAVRHEVDFYGYPLAKNPAEVAEQSLRMVNRNFSVVYLKAGLGRDRDVETVRLVRQAVGPEARIRVDSNEAWDIAEARRVIAAIAPYDIEFVEQPIDARDLVGMRELRRSTPIPIAANQGVWSVSDALQCIRLNTCDVMVTGPYWLGGLLPLQRVGELSAESGVGFCLHAPPATSIGTAAGIQVLATLPSLLDGNQTYLYYLAEDVSDSLGERMSAKVSVPKTPGLGIEVDEHHVREMAKRYEKQGSYQQTGASLVGDRRVGA
jgi:muconate cycloisomerase